MKEYYVNMHYEVENAFTKEQIDEIISIGDNTRPRRTAGMGSRNSQNEGQSPGKRHQANIRVDRIKWLKKHINEIAEKAKSKIELENKISIDISGGIEKGKTWHEFFIYCKYDKSDSYAWHKDSNPETGGRTTKTRVLSMSVQLSEPKDYGKGELLLKSKNKTVTASKNKGNVCVFTADTLHSVSPITEGTRKCAIFWFHKK